MRRIPGRLSLENLSEPARGPGGELRAARTLPLDEACLAMSTLLRRHPP
jgi:hypothetical protein